MNNATDRNSEHPQDSERRESVPAAPRPRGRPRVFANPAAKQREQRRREREKLRRVHELLDAVRNARCEDPILHRRIQEGEDAEVLVALTEYYRQRHWCRPRTTLA